MTIRETVVSFACGGETLVGVLAESASPARLGVVIAVGGPQYRAGSHRQFTLLARHLAAAGYPVLRFDYRGMGDSTGEAVDFESVVPDIAAAVDALMAQLPGLRQVVLWGLCDAASAALLYVGETADPRIGGLCLLNPWVRSETGYARTEVRHYYMRRLLEGSFWLKLLGGGVSVRRAMCEAGGKLIKGFGGRRIPVVTTALSFQRRMVDAVGRFERPILLVLSGNDLTAKEFREHAARDAAWQCAIKKRKARVVELPYADHTFSTAEWREQVAATCAEWLGGVEVRSRLPDLPVRTQ